MSKVEFIVDTRETALIKLIRNDNNINNITTIKSLDIADIIIKYNDKDYLVIERKSLKDLAASISDGRYSSQKLRLKKYAIDNKIIMSNIVYLIEGAFYYETTISIIDNNGKKKDKIVNIPYTDEHKFGRIKYSALKSSMTNIRVRDGFGVIHTTDVNGTFGELIKIFNCLTKYGHYEQLNNGQDQVDNEYSQFIKANISVRKKTNKTPEQCFIDQLCCYPNISVDKARKISAKYKSMPKLISKFESLGTEKEKEELLTEIDGIGKKISKQTYDNIYIDK